MKCAITLKKKPLWRGVAAFFSDRTQNQNLTLTLRKRFHIMPSVEFTRQFFGAGGIAQLGERLHGMQEVSGSIPLISTKSFHTTGTEK
jgi:hypothetical protein